MTEKNSRGTSLEGKSILFWLTPDIEIMNHYSRVKANSTKCFCWSSGMRFKNFSSSYAQIYNININLFTKATILGINCFWKMQIFRVLPCGTVHSSQATYFTIIASDLLQSCCCFYIITAFTFGQGQASVNECRTIPLGI